MLDEKTITKLREGFPEESIQVKDSFKDPKTGDTKILTGYKPQYIVERLNDAFGHENWDFEVKEHGREGDDVWIWGRLTTYITNQDDVNHRKILSFREQFGTSKYNKGTTVGDCYKGAATNALEKCASHYDIGHLAYKGLVEVPDDNPKSKTIKVDKAKKELLVECKKYNINKDAFKTLTKNVLKLEEDEERSIAEMTTEEIEKLTEHLKKNKTPF